MKNSILTELLNQTRHLLVLRLTIFLLLLYGSSTVLLDVPLKILCGLVLLLPSLITNQAIWVIICGLVWWLNATNWLWIDNHQILISYWCLVCSLAVSAKDPDRVLAWNGQIMIGLTFLFATLWKIIGGEYGNGVFLHYTFLVEERVETVATFIGGLSPSTLPQNRLLESIYRQFPQLLEGVTLSSSSRLELFALLASYWTLLIEGSIAISFLGGFIFLFWRFRDWLLILFIATTYFLLPVLGFAYILIIMGLAQCSPRSSIVRTVYLVIFGLLQFARLPLFEVLN